MDKKQYFISGVVLLSIVSLIYIFNMDGMSPKEFKKM